MKKKVRRNKTRNRTFSLPCEIEDRLREQAKAEDRTLSGIGKRALILYFETHNLEVNPRKRGRDEKVSVSRRGRRTIAGR